MGTRLQAITTRIQVWAGFVSMVKVTFCDMGTHTLWLLCSANFKDKCFGIETEALNGGQDI